MGPLLVTLLDCDDTPYLQFHSVFAANSRFSKNRCQRAIVSAQIIFIHPEESVPDIMSKKLYATLINEVAERFFDGDRNFAAKLVKARVVGNTGFTTYSVGQQGSGSHDR